MSRRDEAVRRHLPQAARGRYRHGHGDARGPRVGRWALSGRARNGRGTVRLRRDPARAGGRPAGPTSRPRTHGAVQGGRGRGRAVVSIVASVCRGSFHRRSDGRPSLLLAPSACFRYSRLNHDVQIRPATSCLVHQMPGLAVVHRARSTWDCAYPNTPVSLWKDFMCLHQLLSSHETHSFTSYHDI